MVAVQLVGGAVLHEPLLEGVGVVGVGHGQFSAYVGHAFLVIVLDDGWGYNEIFHITVIVIMPILGFGNFQLFQRRGGELLGEDGLRIEMVVIIAGIPLPLSIRIPRGICICI